MWTDLTTLQTVTALADQLGCGQRSLSSILCTLPLSTALSISPLVVQNHRTDNYTVIGEGLNTRGGNGALTTDCNTRGGNGDLTTDCNTRGGNVALNTDCNTRQATSIKNPKRLDSIHNKRWLIQRKH